MSTMNFPDACISALATCLKYINFTKYDKLTTSKIQRKILNDIVEVVVIHNKAFGAILKAHYGSNLDLNIPSNGYDICLFACRDRYGKSYKDIIHLDTDIIRRCGFDVELIRYVSGIIDARSYNIITTVLNEKYKKVRYTLDGNIALGKFDKYPNLDINLQDDDIHRDIIDNTDDKILFIRENHRTKWLRTLYPTLVSPPMKIPKYYKEYQPIVENTLYDKVSSFLTNNLHLVDFTILPQEIVDNLIEKLNTKNKHPIVKGYFILEESLLNIYALEYNMISTEILDPSIDACCLTVIKNNITIKYKYLMDYKIDKLEVYELNSKYVQWNVTPYTNNLLRNIYNIIMYACVVFNVNLDTGSIIVEKADILEINSSISAKNIDNFGESIKFIKYTPESLRLYNKYERIDGIRLMSDLVDVPIQLFNDEYY